MSERERGSGKESGNWNNKKHGNFENNGKILGKLEIWEI